MYQSAAVPTSSISPAPPGNVSVFSDLYHLGMAGYYTLRLAVKQKAVQNTYGYCYHLEQVSFVDRRFRRWLRDNPAVAVALTLRWRGSQCAARSVASTAMSCRADSRGTCSRAAGS